jgi:molybdate transport system substrate-binding protein
MVVRWLPVLACACAMVLGPVPARAAEEDRPLIFAAASLKTVLDAVFAEAPGAPRVRLSYAGSPTLVRQLELGAPADILIVADSGWMDYAEKRGLVAVRSRTLIATNRLVLIAPKGTGLRLDLKAGLDLAGRLGNGGRLAVGDVNSVPAGKYAKAALEKLGLWPSVAARLAPAQNVRAALALVARGEAPLGIVYATDARAEPRVEVAGTFPADSHPVIVYPAALVAGSRTKAALAAFDRVKSAAAQKIFEAHGFELAR